MTYSATSILKGRYRLHIKIIVILNQLDKHIRIGIYKNIRGFLQLSAKASNSLASSINVLSLTLTKTIYD